MGNYTLEKMGKFRAMEEMEKKVLVLQALEVEVVDPYTLQRRVYWEVERLKQKEEQVLLDSKVWS